MKKILFILLFMSLQISLMLYFPDSTHAYLSGTFYTDGDSWIKENSPTENYGSDTALHVKSASSGLAQRSLLSFDISSIPSGSLIESANLSLYYFNYAVNDPQGRVYHAQMINESWTENGVTWNNQPSVNTTNQANSTVPSSYGWMSWDVTLIVDSWVNESQTNYGFMIRDSDEIEVTAKVAYFHSREYDGLDPKLVIEYAGLTVTFYFNEGGEFRVNCETVTNGTSEEYDNGTVIELSALPLNQSYVFKNFTWNTGSGATNPYNLTVTQNLTVWLFFGTCGDGEPFIVARFTFSPSNPSPDETISFNGSHSESSETITVYSWTFGDGNTSDVAEPTHRYGSEAVFNVELIVTSGAGSDNFIQQITVEEAQTETTVEDGSGSGLYALHVRISYNDIPCSAKVLVIGEPNISLSKDSDYLGNAHFTLPLGIYKITAIYEDETKEETIQLSEDKDVSFKFKGKTKLPKKLGILIIVIILLLGLVWMYPSLMPKKVREKVRKHKPREKPRKHKSTVKPRKHERGK